MISAEAAAFLIRFAALLCWLVVEMRGNGVVRLYVCRHRSFISKIQQIIMIFAIIIIEFVLCGRLDNFLPSSCLLILDSANPADKTCNIKICSENHKNALKFADSKKNMYLCELKNIA